MTNSAAAAMAASENAVAQNLERHRSYLMRVARLQLRDDSLAEDVVQETMLAALKSGTFRGASSLRTWLSTILRHKIIDAIRARQRLNEVSESSGFDSDGEDGDSAFDADGEWRSKPADWGDPEKALDQRQFLDILTACMELLPPRVARVFMMREYMDLDVDEICRELRISPNNAYVMLHQARLGLRGCVESHWLRGRAGA